ncbi:MAG: VOC family protein [Meiothermus sp.]|uniref:VOC family protein n=1 Tax=Meiothermus sp. TaxID=1955249 RepID=UPI0025FD31E8|nr:VOC family protein [Meiothermus sp.]MCS7058368.1 VOC family protein [Meiothermus sp.]MCS7194374.1 VOC family protein [Meiothermus sp.]MDW8089855.1 VOC family protein [Meiothermus sp.]MDW8481719.1 VOC family protein [Meiothermus sp.]
MYTTRLTYVHLYVRHLEASVTFYTRFLDLQVVERFGQTSLLVSSENQAHFELALSQGEPSGPVALGFAAASEADFQAAQEFLLLEGVPFRKEDRGVAQVLCLKDPDGNAIELFLDRRQAGGRDFWRGESRAVEK